MTLNEYLAILSDRNERIKDITNRIIELTQGTVNDLGIKKSELFSELLNLHYSNADKTYIDKISAEVDRISEEIKSEEEYKGMLYLQKEIEDLEHEILDIKSNAREELNEYAFYSEPELCGISEQQVFFSKNGFKKMSPFLNGKMYVVYMLKSNFSYETGNEFLSNIVKYLGNNSVYNGIRSVEIGLHDSDDYYITYSDGLWIIRIDQDVIFEDTNCKEVLNYLNFIR